MATSLTHPGSPAILLRSKEQKKSDVHKLTLALVWLSIASSSIVFSEPAPVDILTAGLFVLLPVIGLIDARPMLVAGLAIWMPIAAFCFFGATLAFDTSVSVSHAAITLYLYGASFLFACFVAKRPLAHTRLILNGYLVAATIAAILGIVGYLDLFPGAYAALTRYDRAAALFKDPNVYGPFLIPGLLTALHLWLSRPMARGLLPLLATGLFITGILFSFSRGAWAGAAVALALYCYLYLLSSTRNIERIKLAGLVLFGAAAVGLVVAASLQSEGVARLLEERAALTQPYDEGPTGRFGGQLKAVDVILDNPLGIGPLQFAPYFHHEEAHNVYLSMMMNAGWPGGLLYLALCALTLVMGFKHALKATRTRPLFVIIYSALAAAILQGLLIDSDHWRHFYLLMGVVWGLMAGDAREIRKAKIVRDRRPILLLQQLIIPPSRRQVRIIGRVPKRPAIGRPERRLPPQRAPRILARYR